MTCPNCERLQQERDAALADWRLMFDAFQRCYEVLSKARVKQPRVKRGFNEMVRRKQ